MKTQLSKFKRVPVSTLRSVLRCCVVHSDADTPAIARSCGIGMATVSKALVVLAEFGLTRGDVSGWRCASSGLVRSSTDEEVDNAIRDALLAYRPFEAICEGLAVGEDLSQAIRHAAVAHNLDGAAEANLSIFVKWGTELSVLTDSTPTRLSASLQSSVESLAALPVAAVSSTAEIRLYISTLLGRDAFDELDEVDRGLLVSAVNTCDSDPPGSVEASGQALEDYLRELCASQGLGADASKLSGAGQLSGLLRNRDVIHPHHVKLIDAASMLRNAKVHKKDRATVAPWLITSLGARTAFGASTLAIRSIHDWVSKGRQTL